MSGGSTWRYRVLRLLGRIVTRTAATITLFRMPPFVSASAIVVDSDRVLVVVDPIKKEAVLPGGHLAWREPPDEAVVREVREETGYLVQIGDLVAVLSGKEWAGEWGIVRVIFTATVIGGELRSSHEGEARWEDVSSVLNAEGRDASVLRLWLDRTATVGQNPGS